MIFFKIIFIVSLVPLFSYGVKLSEKNDIAKKRFLLAKAPSAQKSVHQIFFPAFDANNPQAKGVILKFHNWPAEKDKKRILKKLTKAGLKQSSEIKRFKVWTFEWTKLYKGVKAKKVCKSLARIPSLKYCEPDYLTGPAQKQETINQAGTEYIMLRNWVNNRGLSIVSLIGFLERKQVPIVYVDNPEVPALIAAGKSYSPTVHAIPNTASNKILLVEFEQGRTRSRSSQQLQTQPQQQTQPQPQPQPQQQVQTQPQPVRETAVEPPSNPQPNWDPSARGNLRNCNIIPSQSDLFEGKLSDYWAQEMIGADLLREELSQVPPPDKNLVEVFDSPERNHDVKVRNMISDEGQNAVLPELGDNVGITRTIYTADMLRNANTLLDKVDNVCTASPKESEQSSSNQRAPRQPSSQQKSSSQISSNQAQETTTHGGTDYLMLGAWANNRDYELASVISAMKGKIEYINNPHIAALVAAGESWSPEIHAVPNTASNQALLEAFAQRRGTTVHNKTLNVVWKTATNWDDVWQSKTGDRTPPERYDFKATYELDRDQNTSILARREYRYIFRRPVLDMGGGTKISTSLFNWLPSIVLLNKNGVRKLKIWGTREVGNDPITINGVTVTMTMVAGTISDVPGSALRHGRWEADLTEEQFNTIYNAGAQTSTNFKEAKLSSSKPVVSKNPVSEKIVFPTTPVVSKNPVSEKIVFPTTRETSRGGNIAVVQPKVFFPKKDWENRNIQIAVNLYFGYHDPKYNPEGPPDWAAEELKTYGQTLKKVADYIKKNKADPKVQWVNRSQISQIANCHIQRVDTSTSKLDEKSQYWLSYADAVKKLKG